MFHCDMPLTIKGVPHEARDGLAINCGVPGTIWESDVSRMVSPGRQVLTKR